MSWPVKGSFRISRSTVTQINVVVATVTDGHHTGRGECRPYPRYDETSETVRAQIDSLGTHANILSLKTLPDLLPAGAARNALDCALWDLQAHITGKPVYELLGLPVPNTRQTAFTLSLDSSEKMAKAAREAADHTLLKIKIGGHDGLNCALAVLKSRPDAKLIIDANEALSEAELLAFQTALAGRAVVLIEQPMPAGKPMPNSVSKSRPVICADEALHTQSDLEALWAAGYRAVNIKLDKAGGLTEALATAQSAKAMGFEIMLGCMVSSSLAMAPALLLESFADYIDLDGALLLADDHKNGMIYEAGTVAPAPQTLWGWPRRET